jgi:hypothetical protein
VSALRYFALLALRTRAPLAPTAATILALAGTYAQKRNDVGETYGLTALLACGLSAWLVGAILSGEPAPQADLATVALGGLRGRAKAEALLVAAVATAFSALFMIFPLALGGVVKHVFDRTPDAADLVAAALAHLVCCAFGAALGVALSPPRVTRRATSAAATLVVLLALLAVGTAGPAAVAQKLSGAAPRTLTGAELLASAVCALLAAALLTAAASWTRRRA